MQPSFCAAEEGGRVFGGRGEFMGEQVQAIIQYAITRKEEGGFSCQ